MGHKAACVDMGWLCYGQVKGGYWGCNHNQGVTGSKEGYWGSKHNHLDLVLSQMCIIHEGENMITREHSALCITIVYTHEFSAISINNGD